MSETYGTTGSDIPPTGNGAIKARAQTVVQDLDELRKDVGRLATAATSAAGLQMRSARERIGRLGQDVGVRATRSATYMGEQVRAHPGWAIGISVGAGVLIGMMLASRRSRFDRGYFEREGTRTHMG